MHRLYINSIAMSVNYISYSLYVCYMFFAIVIYCMLYCSYRMFFDELEALKEVCTPSAMHRS